MTPQTRRHFTPRQAAALDRFFAAINSFPPKHKNIERQTVALLLNIAVSPGIARTDLMEAMRMTEGSMTRNCQLLARSHWISSRPSPKRSNALTYRLTSSGSRFVRKLVKAVQKPNQTGTRRAAEAGHKEAAPRMTSVPLVV